MRGGTLGELRWVLLVAILATGAGIVAGDDAVAEFASVGVSSPEPGPIPDSEPEWAEGKAWTRNLGEPEPTAKGQFIAAFRFDIENRSFDAARQYYLLLRAYPHSGEAELALQRLAKCLYDMEDYPASLQAIRQAMADYPDSGGSEISAEITMLIAARILADAASSDSLENSRASEIRKALAAIDTALELDPSGPFAAEGFFIKGVGSLRIGEVAAARAAFETVRAEFPGSDLAEAAQLGLLRCDALTGKYDHGDPATRERDEAEAAKLLEAAEEYRRGNSDTADKAVRYLYSDTIRCWPATPQAAEAWERLTEFVTPRQAERAFPSVAGEAAPPEEDLPWPMPDITEMMNALAEPAEVPGVPEPPAETPLLDATAGTGGNE